ncbi:DUF4843 domain-containing protein [Sphingobacterium sp.]|uniref:DUF4843 domain-containing protein n=1 Tax=Sphingobacterium sp. TaxID=341027 RepID=UPI0025FC1D0D|nr:DUF4843 domain-containing protein [Sphingobacterium sp.]
MKFNPILFMLLGMLLLFSCKKASLITYDQPANVYFDLNDADRDSIIYTFAYDLEKSSDTVYFPVKIMGYRDAKPRKYEAYIVADSSTAKMGIHYDKLETAYTLKAEEGRAYLPIIVHNVKDLEDRAVSLIIKLRENSDFGIRNPDLIRVKLVLSAKLERPSWWDNWLNNYSQVKHQLFYIATEQKSLTTNGLDAPKNLYFVNLLLAMLNDPFKWVIDHPEKGYALTTKDNGETYEFYPINNPGRKILIKRNNATGKYFFIDENGKEVR